MQSVIILPIPVLVPVANPVASNGWLRGPKRPWVPKPRPTRWPLKQSIPSPGVRESLEQARRMLAEHRRLRRA
jgi:hypothetical protein